MTIRKKLSVQDRRQLSLTNDRSVVADYLAANNIEVNAATVNAFMLAMQEVPALPESSPNSFLTSDTFGETYEVRDYINNAYRTVGRDSSLVLANAKAEGAKAAIKLMNEYYPETINRTPYIQRLGLKEQKYTCQISPHN